MFKILERSKITLETGKWYAISWWQEDKYYENGLATKEKVKISFNELIRVFDEKWMLEQIIINNNKQPSFLHPLANRLIEEGILPFKFLYSLGLDLYTVRREGLIEDLERRLKNPREYWEAAAFELKFLSKFLQQGFDVRKNYESNKGKNGKCNCDFKISKGNETVFLEIKRPTGVHSHNIEIINKDKKRFWTQLLNEDVEVENFIGKPLLAKVEIGKVFHHIRRAVKNQIPDEGPGIVIVELPQIIEFKQVEYAVGNRLWNRGKNSHQKYAHLSAICLVKVFFDANKGFIRNNISIILNPKAKINVSSYAATETIFLLAN